MPDGARNTVEIMGFGVKTSRTTLRVLPIIHRGNFSGLCATQAFCNLKFAAIFAIWAGGAIFIASS